VTPPILNRMTRLAALANAATGELLVQGWEESGPATAMFDLAAATTAKAATPLASAA
jgi:hypothetical protein